MKKNLDGTISFSIEAKLCPNHLLKSFFSFFKSFFKGSIFSSRRIQSTAQGAISRYWSTFKTYFCRCSFPILYYKTFNKSYSALHVHDWVYLYYEDHLICLKTVYIISKLISVTNKSKPSANYYFQKSSLMSDLAPSILPTSFFSYV